MVEDMRVAYQEAMTLTFVEATSGTGRLHCSAEDLGCV